MGQALLNASFEKQRGSCTKIPALGGLTTIKDKGFALNYLESKAEAHKGNMM